VTLRIISSASVRRSEEEKGSPNIEAERSEHHGHRPPCKDVSVSGDFVLRLDERPGEAHLLRDEMDTCELRHAGVSPLFVDSNQGITQHNVTGVGILLTVILTCESLRVRRRVSGITGPMKP